MNKIKSVLIAGGSGLVGSALSTHLKKKGFRVSILTRATDDNPNHYGWSVDKGWIEDGALEQADALINLSGAPISTRPWTSSYKKKIRSSRINSTRLLFDEVKKRNPKINVFISASAIGYYGPHPTNHMFTEADPPGKNFLAKVCVDWEKESRAFEELGIRNIQIRTGVVLARDDGALPQMVRPVRWFLGAPLGSGHQTISWIHLDDLVRLYTFALTHPKLAGPINAVAPHPTTNHSFMKTLAHTLHRPLWPLPVPGLLIKLIWGKRSTLILDGVSISSTKTLNHNFSFKYSHLNQALKNILS